MEYTVDCTGWNREKLMDLLSHIEENANTKIVLYVGKTACEQEKAWEKIVGEYLNKMGILPHLKGYGYLKYGIVRCIEHTEELECVTKILYPEIAKKYNTTSGKVEHGIRHAIYRAWEKEKSEMWETIFGKSCTVRTSKPTNSQFIAALSDYILINN